MALSKMQQMLNEHSQVVLKNPLSNLGLESDATGVVVHVYDQGIAYEVEFFGVDGHTIGVETVPADDLQQA